MQPKQHREHRIPRVLHPGTRWTGADHGSGQHAADWQPPASRMPMAQLRHRSITWMPMLLPIAYVDVDPIRWRMPGGAARRCACRRRSRRPGRKPDDFVERVDWGSGLPRASGWRRDWSSSSCSGSRGESAVRSASAAATGGGGLDAVRRVRRQGAVERVFYSARVATSAGTCSRRRWTAPAARRSRSRSTGSTWSGATATWTAAPSARCGPSRSGFAIHSSGSSACRWASVVAMNTRSARDGCTSSSTRRGPVESNRRCLRSWSANPAPRPGHVGCGGHARG